MTCPKCNETEGKIRERIEYLELCIKNSLELCIKNSTEKEPYFWTGRYMGWRNELEFLKSLLEREDT